ncbi:MAG: hypothetical protein P4L84_12625 [Isosphaeraceae bacterium]|nr:hypothetical protein [Isosphaeraceae bacterium]
MSGDPATISHEAPPESVELPRPTVAPLVLALGLALMAAGVATSLAFVVVGAALLIAGLGLWVAQFVPGRGHVHEPLAAPSRRPRPVAIRPGGVGHMHEGMPGYRLRLPTEVHPISAGIKGGLVGGLLMPVPALLWGLLSGHGIWYPVNLIAGMALPGVDRMSVSELEQFRPVLLVVGLLIHAVNSATFGMIYGVLLPTLPSLPKPVAWGGLLMPLLWTAVSFGLMGVVNPLLKKGVDWPWFIASQFLFGLAVAAAILRLKTLPPVVAGLVAGAVGGAIMPVPAALWGWLSGRGIWYPANLLVGMVSPGVDALPLAALSAFRPGWLAIAIAIHVTMSLTLGAILGVILPRLRPIPATLAWGALIMPLLWTAGSYALMGVVNPLLQERVDWFWFIASQFVFGVAAAVVVDRSEKVFIPPAGRGPDSMSEFATGTDGGGP